MLFNVFNSRNVQLILNCTGSTICRHIYKLESLSSRFRIFTSLLSKMSSIDTAKLHSPINVFGKNDFYLDSTTEEELSDIEEKSECGTQTNFNRKAKPIPSGMGSPTLVNRVAAKHITPSHKPKRRKIKLMDWKKFHRLSVINAFIDDLEKDYPAICTVTVIGKSVEGREIRMLKISNSDATNEAVWIDGTIHSREWISAAVVTYLADQIVRNFDRLPTSVTNKDWHIVAVLNPDGYEYSHSHDRMWRKNRASYGGERVGVDLNRNFSVGWGTHEELGSSEDPNNVFFRGPEPFSEPESVAVRDTILGTTTPFKVFLSFHSYFELIIFPWGHRKEPCPDYLNLLEAGTAMSRVTPSKRKYRPLTVRSPAKDKSIQETTGKTYKVGSTKDLTYDACGTSIDWSYSVAQIPYSYMIELRGKKHKFKLPRDQILDNCKEIWNGLQSLLRYVDEH